MPKGLAQFDSSTQHFNLVGTSGRCVGGDEFLVVLGDEIFVMTVAQDSFKHVLALAHTFCFPVRSFGMPFQPAGPCMFFDECGPTPWSARSTDAEIIDVNKIQSRKLCEGSAPLTPVHRRELVPDSHSKSMITSRQVPHRFRMIRGISCQGGNPQHCRRIKGQSGP